MRRRGRRRSLELCANGQLCATFSRIKEDQAVESSVVLESVSQSVRGDRGDKECLLFLLSEAAAAADGKAELGVGVALQPKWEIFGKQ